MASTEGGAKHAGSMLSLSSAAENESLFARTRELAFLTQGDSSSSSVCLVRQQVSDSLIQDQLRTLQKEIHEMNSRLAFNEKNLQDKREENELLKELVTSLQHQVTMKKALRIETKTKSGCCTQSECTLF